MHCGSCEFVLLLSLVGRELSVMSTGQRFMTDLLVSSLMADGGLESSLNLAIKAEIQELEEKKASGNFFYLYNTSLFFPHSLEV